MTNYVASIKYLAIDCVTPALKRVQEVIKKTGSTIKDANISAKLSSMNLGNAVGNLGGGFKKFGSSALGAVSNVARGLSKLAVAARGTLLTIGAGALLSLKGTASYMQQVKSFMRVSGQGAGDSSILVSLAGRYKLDANLLGRSMTILSKKAMENSKSFRKWGLDLKDSQGHLLPATKMLELVAYKYKQLGGGLQGAAMAQALMGRGALKLLPVLKLGADGINKYSIEAAKMGLVLTEKNIADFDKYMQSTRQVQGCLAGLQVQLGVKLLPHIVKICNWVSLMVQKWENLKPALRDNIFKWGAISAVILAVLPTIIKLCDKVASLGTWFSKTNIAFEAYCAIAGTVETVMGSIATAAAAISAPLWAVYAVVGVALVGAFTALTGFVAGFLKGFLSGIAPILPELKTMGGFILNCVLFPLKLVLSILKPIFSFAFKIGQILGKWTGKGLSIGAIALADHKSLADAGKEYDKRTHLNAPLTPNAPPNHKKSVLEKIEHHIIFHETPNHKIQSVKSGTSGKTVGKSTAGLKVAHAH